MSNFRMYFAPMCGGKTFELIREMERCEEAGLRVVGLKPGAELRDTGIQSRDGPRREAIVVKDLGEAALLSEVQEADVLGIDEIFMFNEDPARTRRSVARFLSQGKLVRAATLERSGMGETMSVVAELMTLKPKPEVVFCTRSVCGTDHGERVMATETKIIDRASGKQIRSGLPELVAQDPDDPKYDYVPACHSCFYDNTNVIHLSPVLDQKTA